MDIKKLHKHDRFYLDRIGCNSRSDNLYRAKTDSRIQRFNKEIREYGFSSADTWNMDTTMLQLLYERIKCFEDYNIVDLDRHKFNYQGKEFTQQEIIDMIVERLEFILYKKDYADKEYYKNTLLKNRYVLQYGQYDDCQPEQTDLVTEIWVLWSIIQGAMWW